MIRSVSLICAVFLAVSPSSTTQQPFRLQVEGVRLEVQVTRAAQAVPGLQAADFEVSDDGVKQEVSSAAAVGRLDLVVSLDVSSSMQGKPAESAAKCVTDMSAAISAEDTVSFMTFAEKAQVILRPTKRPDGLVKAVANLPPITRTMTALSDALVAAASMNVASSGIPVIAVVSDGGENSSWLSLDTAAEILSRSGVILDWWQVGYVYRSTFPQPDEAYGAYVDELRAVVRQAGGATADAAAPAVARAIRDRFTDLRNSYLVTFVPKNVKRGDGWHKIKVDVRLKGASVKTRAAYWSSPE